MPMAKEKSSAGLSIELNDNRKYYTIGSKVSGNVTLDTAQDFAIGSVSIEFYGRVKVFYVQHHGQGESQWRGRAPLFSESALLFEGYHTHKPGSFNWPFTFEIPTHPDTATIKQTKHQWGEKEHFLSTNDYIPHHPMPETFAFRKFGWGYRLHVFVEYVLKVEVKQAEGARLLLPPASREATLPVLVKHVSTDTSNTHCLPLSTQFTLPDQLMTKSKSNNSQLDGPKLQTQILRPTVRSSRLTTWNKSSLSTSTGTSSFSFREKTRQVFNSSSLPRYSFEVSVSTPESVQVLRENALPFMVSASTIKDGDSTTIRPEDYPDIRIDNASLSLTAITYLRFRGPFSSRPIKFDIKLLDRHPIDYTIRTSPHRSAADSGFNQDTSDGNHSNKNETSNSVDLSQLPGVSLAIIAAKLGRQTEKPLSTSFNTYIIAREYRFKWKLELDVAGEKVTLQNDGDVPVTILPPESEALDTIMNEDDVTGLINNEDEDANAEVSDDSADAESVDTKRPLSGLLKLRKGKKTKEEEAAEDRESPPEQSSSSQHPLQFQHDEMLPRYEQAPSNFGYRHEIGERPPRYENE